MRRSINLIIVAILLGVSNICICAQQSEQLNGKQLYSVGWGYYYGENGFEKNLSKAYANFLKAAEKGYIAAYNQVGYMLEVGEGTAKNLNSAFNWYHKSADAGNANGQYSLAWCYQHGTGVSQNYKLALQWYRSSAAQGYVDAFNKLGYMLENGLGEFNPSEAFRYYKEAANKGDDVGQYYLGICYVNGTGTTCNDEQARMWLTKSANQGNKNAKTRLLEMDMPDYNLPPSISFIDFTEEVADPTFILDVGVKANNGKVTNTAVYLNGNKLPDSRGLRTVKDDGFQMRWKNTLQLVEGQNKIKVEVTNRAGKGIKEGFVTYKSNNKATIEWLTHESTTNRQEYQIKANIRSESKIESVVLTLNGEQISLDNQLANNSRLLSLNRTVSLVEGNNTIRLSVSNIAGSMVDEISVNYIKPQKRLALLIGNSNYLDPDKSLRNPSNDASDFSRKLESLGFDVILKTDADKRAMDQSIYEFGEKAKNYDVALFYYAGHGIQNNGTNYLIPVDVALKAEDDVKYDCVNANRVLDKMENSHCKAKIVILDACRNNPFERSWHRGATQVGLSMMNAPEGIFIAYATNPGNVAQDGEGRNSPYTEALLKMLDQPNLPLETFFKNVLREVKRKTKGIQSPWVSSSFDGEFYFNKK